MDKTLWGIKTLSPTEIHLLEKKSNCYRAAYLSFTVNLAVVAAYRQAWISFSDPGNSFSVYFLSSQHGLAMETWTLCHSSFFFVCASSAPKTVLQQQVCWRGSYAHVALQTWHYFSLFCDPLGIIPSGGIFRTKPKATLVFDQFQRN